MNLNIQETKIKSIRNNKKNYDGYDYNLIAKEI